MKKGAKPMENTKNGGGGDCKPVARSAAVDALWRGV